ncbi:hypothetical protein BsIDN1_28520 [Bacillus safensis]|uniref:Helicase/UvrB N-terminal domain-containing protein n=1 Tax=Bacillus safensis TaxID=561879 RepID=A0A5S9MAQ6_BACIA|nr:hypothetical protein BsIDN1_28520 [Bacillus safensis]
MQTIDHVLQKGKEAIVLVPEISLTPQMVQRFKERFGSNVAVLHSGLSTGEKNMMNGGRFIARKSSLSLAQDLLFSLHLKI